jgi:nucleotide-binding universal stress UspA family protein
VDGYRTVVVGTDGSESSMRAVTRAGEVAAQEDAKLIIASAHIETVEKGGWSRAPSHDHVSDPRAADSLGGEGYILHGNAPVYGILREAHDKATAAGRLLGSVPAEVARRARIDILIVHTAD